ncbi:YceD family protein [Sporosarcina thermotolerans]|uniref:YceD family protein n=1 Tax=Sporosarcina thermotolerans TaxID=633404 RepID=A0AAW9A9M7_9BACL|nr:YceD family protein [Sporosarcina thermotolerans]MDW0115833.1 YceD family protein [Sporosarcina thermotolerans]WHT46936.1 YceD family protein [Sporosarcina thermotolerans]
MKWSIHQLQKYRQGAMPLDEAVNLETVKKRNPEIRDIKPVHVTGSCVIGSKKLSCRFHLEGVMTLPCSRTWVDVEFPFSIETNEQFSWDEATLASDDSIHPVEGEVVDPTLLFEELILLEVPLQVFSEEAEKMKRAEGKGWSYTTEDEYDAQLNEEKENKVDPRLAGLAEFFNSDKE